MQLTHYKTNGCCTHTLKTCRVQLRRKTISASRVKRPNSHSATFIAPITLQLYLPFTRPAGPPKIHAASQPSPRQQSTRATGHVIIAATEQVMPSSDDGTGVAGDTGPQVGALLGDGPVDRGTCRKKQNCQAKTIKSAFHSRNCKLSMADRWCKYKSQKLSLDVTQWQHVTASA